MIDAVTMTAASMSDDMQRLATISHNLANATTPGFKRDIALYGRFARMLQEADIAQAAGTAVSGAGEASSKIDQQDGSLRFTGNAFDLALEGSGFFELAGAEGPLYSRQGDFHLDARGRLVNANGLPVMGTGGEIYMLGGDTKVERDGRIFEDGKQIAQLKIVDFEQPDALLKAGNGLYAAMAGQAPKEDTAGSDRFAQLRPSHLENSNVVPVSEMVRLIETIRHFESQQKVIQGYDEMLERVIRSLGEV
jgi:flagellar basal-body rod protein FlgG